MLLVAVAHDKQPLKWTMNTKSMEETNTNKIWAIKSSGMLHRADWVVTNVSEEGGASETSVSIHPSTRCNMSEFPPTPVWWTQLFPNPGTFHKFHCAFYTRTVSNDGRHAIYSDCSNTLLSGARRVLAHLTRVTVNIRFLLASAGNNFRCWLFHYLNICSLVNETGVQKNGVRMCVRYWCESVVSRNRDGLNKLTCTANAQHINLHHQAGGLRALTLDSMRANICYSESSPIHWDETKSRHYTERVWGQFLQNRPPVLLCDLRHMFCNNNCIMQMQKAGASLHFVATTQLCKSCQRFSWGNLQFANAAIISSSFPACSLTAYNETCCSETFPLISKLFSCLYLTRQGTLTHNDIFVTMMFSRPVTGVTQSLL